MKKHNFYAGPSILSEYTIKNTAAAVGNFVCRAVWAGFALWVYLFLKSPTEVKNSLP